MNTIVHHITIAHDMQIITIMSGLKVSKYNRNNRNSNIKNKILIKTNFLIILSPITFVNITVRVYFCCNIHIHNVPMTERTLLLYHY